MRDRVKGILEGAVAHLAAEGRFPGGLPILVETSRDESFGDFTTNLAMTAASRARVAPRQLAAGIAEAVGNGEGFFERVEVAGPGFINFFISRAEWYRELEAIGAAGNAYGNCDLGGGRKVQVEFVSANPTGPLHVGHGRGAAVGDVLASLLSAAGFDVTREYYVNDAGRQMDLLGASVLARYREALGSEGEFPEDGYRGDYLREIARDLILKKGETLLGLPGETARAEAGAFAREWVLRGIKKDLADFGVSFEHWTSEQQLLREHPLPELFAELTRGGLTYESEGALWLRTTSLGDDKDRVLLRGNGQATYFANDILYHRQKYRRGFEQVIDIWGADHHGYVDRMAAAVKALGHPDEAFRVILVQLVRLLRGGEVVAMSTRQGEFTTLREVLDEVGRDAARFFFVSRKSDAQLDFDLELASRQSSENPVYYVQYAHARIRSIFMKLEESGTGGPEAGAAVLARLDEPEEISLIKQVVMYPDVVAAAAEALEPHRIPFFLQELAGRFHGYYNRHRVISADEDLTAARLYLVRVIGQVLAHGLNIIGVSAPENM